MRITVNEPKLAPLPEVLDAPALDNDANFEAVTIRVPDWTGVQTRRVDLDGVSIEQGVLNGAVLAESSWLDVRVTGVQAGGLNVSGLVARRVLVDTSRLSGCILSDATLEDLQWRSCKLDMTNFRFAKLKNVIFKDCDLTDADFAGANLDNVMFASCTLERADFSAASMHDVDLTGSELVDLKGIKGLAGATIADEQLIALAPAIALELGIKLKDRS